MPTMRAARYYGKEDIRIEEIDEPVCGKGQVQIKPAFVGICGTDLHEYLGGPTFCPTTPHPVTGATIPITLGHEFSGTITALGSDLVAKGHFPFVVGQKVVIQPTIADLTCAACTQDLQNICYSGGFIGLSGGGGGLSDSLVVPHDRVLALPNHIGLDVGALVEPLAVGWHAVSRSPLKPDSTVLILGGGPIGIAVLLALKARGCSTIIVSEVSKARQDFATRFGADHVFNPKNDDVVKKVRELTDGEGVHVVFDCAGVKAGLETACQAIRVRGTVVNVAIWEGEVGFNPNLLVFREGNYVACLGYVKQDFRDVIAAIADGSMQPQDMITSKIALVDLVTEGFEELIHNKEEHVKIMVDLQLGKKAGAGFVPE